MKKLIIAMMTIVLLGTIPAKATCPNAIRLNVGDKVIDCDRIGLSIEYDKRIRKELIEGEYDKKIVKEQKRQITMKDLTIQEVDKRSDLWEKESERLREENDELKKGNNWKFWVGIFSGIALTVLSGWSVGQIAK